MGVASLARVETLHRDAFVTSFLTAGRPLLVAGAAATWPALRRWTWDRLVARFGEDEVDVFGDWFVPTGSARLAEFVAESVAAAAPDVTRAYVRWSSRDRGGPGRWADGVFEALARDWRQPAFLPQHGYVVPFAPAPGGASAVTDPFPYRGLLLSGAGARTRLHVDPWASSAVLCQVSGRKRLVLHDPEQGERLVRAAAAGARETDLPPAFEEELAPGDVLYIPPGWWHHATSLTASITITWNFVHAACAEGLRRHAREHADDPELAVVDYFLTGRLGAGMEGAGTAALVEAALGALAGAG